MKGKVMLTKKFLAVLAVVGVLALGGAGLTTTTGATGAGAAGGAGAAYDCSAAPYPEIDLAGCGLKDAQPDQCRLDRRRPD